MAPLIDEALAIVQEHGLKIIACGEDKAPIHKGWRDRASSDPEKIREMFSDLRAKLVGVPMGKANDLITFDLDYREGNTPERNAKLAEFEAVLREAHGGQIRTHATRNGGKHLIMLNPEGVAKIPRNLMPKLEMCGDGFQIIWPTEGSGYTVVDDVPLDDLTEPDPSFLKVREKMKGLSSSGGLMDAELAREVMVSDGEVGTRHDALLRMTYDFVGNAPDDMAPDALCRSFEAQFREVFGSYLEGSRLEELMHWTWDGETLGGSDLGNAMKGAIERHPERSGRRLAEMERPGFAVWDQQTGDPAEPLVETPEAEPPPAPTLRQQLTATEVSWSTQVPPRQWLLSHRVERCEVSVLQAPPGTGKTAVLIGWTGVVASGVSFLGETAWGGPKTVVYLNGEDANPEILRRFQAFRMQHKNAGSLINERVHYVDFAIPLVKPDPAAKRRVVAPDNAVIADLEEKLAELGTDLLVIDPLSSIHDIREGDFGEMATLVQVLRRLARKLDMGILVANHWKTPERYEDEQPAPSPITNLARHVTQLRQMNEGEATSFAVPAGERHRHLRVADVKANNEAMAGAAWLKMQSVDLGNGDGVYASDKVAVVASWSPGSDPRMAQKVEEACNLLREEWERDIKTHERRVLAWGNSPRWFGEVLIQSIMQTSVQSGVDKKKLSEHQRRAHDEAVGIINTLIELKLIRTQPIAGLANNRVEAKGYVLNEVKFEAGLWKDSIK